jgi:alkylation response protein AidB-like acyl-CoA dehydrogenase
MLLADEKKIAQTVVPDLVRSLESLSLLELERSGSEFIATLFRDCGGANLLVAKELGGGGMSGREIAQLLTWVGSHCPALAVMMTMHHHTVAGMMAGSQFFPQIKELLGGVAQNNWLVASAFSEGRAHSHNLQSKMRVERAPGGYTINGAKKPCTMTHHFDVITMGVNYAENAGPTRIGIGMAFADDPAIERRKFWGASHLQAADSNEIIFRNLFVPEQFMCFSDDVDGKTEQDKQVVGENMFAIWFQLLAAASYLGMASAMAKQALSNNKGSETDRVALLIDIQGASASLAGLAELVDKQSFCSRSLAKAQAIRFSVQEAVHRISTKAFEVMGGIAFLTSEEPSYLLVATRLLSFHPSSKLASSSLMCAELT